MIASEIINADSRFLPLPRESSKDFDSMIYCLMAAYQTVTNETGHNLGVVPEYEYGKERK